MEIGRFRVEERVAARLTVYTVRTGGRFEPSVAVTAEKVVIQGSWPAMTPDELAGLANLLGKAAARSRCIAAQLEHERSSLAAEQRP